MKNQYSKFVKYLEKQERVVFQRAGDSVYLTDGMVAIKVPVAIYTSLIRPLSGIFLDAVEDCVGEKCLNDEVVKPTNKHIDIRNLVERISDDKIVTPTRFLVEVPSKGKVKKPAVARVFLCDDTIITVDNRLLDAVADCPVGGVWTSAGTWNAPLIQRHDDFAIVVMPMRVDQEVFDVWKCVK